MSQNPLDAIVEELAGLIARFETCAKQMGTDPEYVGEATAPARAALQVARAMRESAVVGWVRAYQAVDAHASERVFVEERRSWERTLKWDPALLIPLPLPPETGEAEHG